MSGFAGIVPSEEGTPDTKLLDRIAGALAFRGPDATQIWTRPGAGLCFALLRTGPATQAATQPCSLDGKLWLLGDVRLDARGELLDQLAQSGSPLSAASSDEELILSAWHVWEAQSLERLSGDFSFALWDQTSRQLWCVRDLLGARPFFYAQVGGQLFFSNTLDALRLTPDISTNLDPHFVGDFLLQSWCPDPHRSVFRDIRRLPPGHLLTFAPNNSLNIRRFASLPIEEPLLLKKPEEYIEQFCFHFERAVRDRIPHGPAAVFMSGGLDSTSVAATAKKVQLSRQIQDSPRAFTVHYSPLFDDQEGPFATSAAQHIGIPIALLNGSASVPFADWEALRLRTPEPCAEPFFALHVEHYREVASYARVVLTGDGGDDILTGRAWPHLAFLLRRGRWPSVASVFGGYLLRHGSLPPLRIGIRGQLRRWLGHPDADLASSYPAWLEHGFERELNLQDRWRELQQPPKYQHPLHPVGYASLSCGYWSSVYETEDAGWTRVPVEARAPFLDQRLIRFLLRLPPVPWCMDKYLLRQAMAGALPDSVRLRRKTPLAGDPLLLHTQKSNWSPLLQNGSCHRLAKFVNCSMLTATSHPDRCLSLWNEIRPLALDIWLKSVEMERTILYSRMGEP